VTGERIERWRDEGELREIAGRRIFVRQFAGDGPPLLLLHGFPSSSYDWRQLVAHLPGGRAVLAFDFLGFGFSDKPRRHEYSLFEQADLTEELVRGWTDGPVQLVAHDMGTSVATELLARDIEGRLRFELASVLLFNGSMIVERATLTSGQRLLRSPLGPLFAQLSTKRVFSQQFAGLFSPSHPLEPDELDDQWALWTRAGGQRNAHRLIGYVDERIRFADRWHGALRDWPGDLAFAWGMLDPVATPNVLAGLRELRPHAPVTELPDLGHYPQIEEPGVIAEIVASPSPA
jgi:pimeloyl-ACP methyl ester carboxylesterase